MQFPDSLTEREAFVLGFVRQAESGGEHILQETMHVYQQLYVKSRYQFVKMEWEEAYPGYKKRGEGIWHYSAELHDDFEALVRKGYLERDPEMPIKIREKGDSAIAA